MKYVLEAVYHLYVQHIVVVSYLGIQLYFESEKLQSFCGLIQKCGKACFLFEKAASIFFPLYPLFLMFDPWSMNWGGAWSELCEAAWVMPKSSAASNKGEKAYLNKISMTKYKIHILQMWCLPIMVTNLENLASKLKNNFVYFLSSYRPSYFCKWLSEKRSNDPST